MDKNETIAYCGACGHQLTFCEKEYITKCFHTGDDSLGQIHLGFFCPKCSSITDVSYPTNSSVIKFLEAINVYNSKINKYKNPLKNKQE